MSKKSLHFVQQAPKRKSATPAPVEQAPIPKGKRPRSRVDELIAEMDINA